MINPNTYNHHEQHVSEDVNDKLTPPKGWIAVTHVVDEKPRTEAEKHWEEMVMRYLPIATKLSENLVDAIEHRTSIIVPESYLRIETDTKFHVVLLVKDNLFHVPEMAIAHILADEYTQTETRFDLHFTFSVLTEFNRRLALYPDEYKLKHDHHLRKTQAGIFPSFAMK